MRLVIITHMVPVQLLSTPLVSFLQQKTIELNLTGYTPLLKLYKEIKMTNEQVIEAVNRLTESYNSLRDQFDADFAEVKRQAAILQPLYKNGQIIWDGREDFQMTDELLTNLIGVGTGAVEAGNKLEQYASEKKSELSALITAAETALKEKTADAMLGIKTAQEKAETEYNAKLKEIVNASKLETEKAVLQAKKDLEEQGKAVSLKIGGEMKEQLDIFGETLGKKITEANTAIESTFKSETKKISDKLELEMLKLRDVLIYENADNTIIIKHNKSNKSLSLLMKIKNLKNGLLKNEQGQIVPVGYNLALNTYFNVDKFCKDEKDYCEIHTNTVVSMHFPDLTSSSNISIEIHNFYFLENIYIPLRDDSWGEKENEQLKALFHITDCPNFKGFKKIN